MRNTSTVLAGSLKGRHGRRCEDKKYNEERNMVEECGLDSASLGQGLVQAY
jgi:hypothetical protein